MSSLYCLDVSMSVGRAFFGSPTALPKCWTWKAKSPWDSPQYAPYFLEIETWLRGELDVLRPDMLGFESPVLMPARAGRGSDEGNVRRLVGVVSIIELVCLKKGIPCYEVHVQTAKSFMGIPGRRPQGMSTGQYKDLMTHEMVRIGYKVADSHQSDACAIGRVIYSDLGLLGE